MLFVNFDLNFFGKKYRIYIFSYDKTAEKKQGQGLNEILINDRIKKRL